MHGIKTFCIGFLLLFVGWSAAISQVQSIKYHIRYNKTTCLYDACIIITEGIARTAIQRVQFNAQYSVLVPAGSEFTVAASRMPLQNNQNYTGTQPLNWYVGSVIQSPSSMPQSDFYSIIPSLTPTSFYNNLNPGDTVVLFSLRITPTVLCGTGIRPFENGVDPDSYAPGMEGGDFTNGFTMGGVNNIYTGNASNILPPIPSINNIATSCSAGLTIDLSASTLVCQQPLSYNWTGPNGFVSSQEDVSLPAATALNNGVYKVKVTDAYGCMDSVSINAVAKPNVTGQTYVQCFQNGAASVSSDQGGVWSIGPASAGTALIDRDTAKNTFVSQFSHSGLYYIIRTNAGCSDTLVIQVGSDCNCNISNILNNTNEHLYCNDFIPFQITGNTIQTSGNYQWIYRLNNQSYQNAPGVNNLSQYFVPSLSAGQYEFRRIFITAGPNVCRDTSNLVTVTVLSKPDAGTDRTLMCLDNANVTLTSSGNGLWSVGQGSAGNATLSSLTNPTVVVSGFTNYGSYYILRSNPACSDTAVIQISDLCGCDIAQAGQDKNVCAGDTLLLTAGCRVGKWHALNGNPAGLTIDTLGQGNAIARFTAMAQGEYNIELRINETLKDTIKITVQTLPNIDAGQNFGFCAGAGTGPVILTASGGVTYIWSTGQTANSIQVNPSATTTYRVRGFSSMGCESGDSITISIYQKPSGSVPYIPPVYMDEPIMLSAGNWQNAMTFHWTGPNNFEATQPNTMIPSASMQNSGMYVLTVMSPDDCAVNASVQVVVLERPLPVRWLAFSGYWNKAANTNELIWKTGQEINLHRYEVERSSDQVHFNMIGTVEAENKPSFNRYNFTDNHIDSDRKYYYRIKQIDQDQRYHYSEIIAVNTGARDIYYMMSPNPAIQDVYLRLNADLEEPMSIEVYQTSGVKVFHNQFYEVRANENLMAGFNAADLPPGLYLVKLVSGSYKANLKLNIVK